MRNLMKILVQYHNLDPTALVDAWSDWVDRAARTWLESEHLQKFIIEFYKPGTTVALARWDFPIRYDGNGVDEMWIDRSSCNSRSRSRRRRLRAAFTAFSCWRPAEHPWPVSAPARTTRSMASLPVKQAP